MSKTGTVACIATFVLAASAALNVQQSRERARLASEVLRLQQVCADFERTVQHERTALRNAQDELHLARGRERPQPQVAPAVAAASVPSAPAPMAAAPASTVPPARSAMLNYLGDPVPAPANLDPKYSAEGVFAGFKTLCESQGIKVDRVGIDTTEFPFVLYGIVNDHRDFVRQIKPELSKIPGYSDSGSVSGRTKDGSTYFALNVTPSREYPREQAAAINRRLMLRLQMLAAAWEN